MTLVCLSPKNDFSTSCLCWQYGIKKKEVPVAPVEDPGLEGRLGRKKKTPEELAAEANGDPEEAAAQSIIDSHFFSAIFNFFLRLDFFSQLIIDSQTRNSKISDHQKKEDTLFEIIQIT